MNFDDKEVLLSVRNLCQFFKMGRGELRAVDNVSFDIHRGEVLGIVGESGCGKTTTGRTIIKLYPATSGDVYFKGDRICAGTRSYKDEIARIKAETKAKLSELAPKKGEAESEAQKSARLDAEAKVKADASKRISEERVKIKAAKHDQKYCDKDYQKEQVKKVKEKYLPLLAKEKIKANTVFCPEVFADYKALKKEYRAELRIAKHERLVTQIQMIFQDPIASLNPRMTVREIIAEGLIIKGIRDKEVINKAVYDILETVGLVREHADRYPHEFSGGQRQRIGIARSVVMNPAMIIADEPVSALDVSIQAQVINLLNDLRERLNLTIMFIAHDLSVVKYFSDRIGVMYFGTMVELTTSDELFAHPMHPYTRSLLSAIPLPDPHYEKQRVRITYNPLAEHDYSVDKPSMREVVPGHFVYCNDAEEAKYREEIK